MTVHTLKPSYIEVDYHSDDGHHKMFLPTKQHFPPTEDFAMGYYVNWSDENVDAIEMYTALLESFLPNFPESVAFDSVNFWDFSDEANKFIWSCGTNLVDFVGSSVTPGWFKAAEGILSFRTTLGNVSKLTLLDVATANNWDKKTALEDITALEPTVDAWTSVDWAWAGRDNARPAVFRQYTKNLNEKLRVEYDMT
jgi:hypothetical protein